MNSSSRHLSPVRRALAALGLVLAWSGAGCNKPSHGSHHTSGSAAPAPSDATGTAGETTRAAARSPSDAVGAASGAKPPSTGKEMQRQTVKVPTPDEARAQLKKALAAALKKDCDQATNAEAQSALSYAHAEADPAGVKQNADAFVALGRCAEKVRAYRMMVIVGVVLAKTDPKLHPEILPRALIGFGDRGDADAAVALLVKAAKANPNDADVTLTLAKAYCKEHKWDDCAKAADQTLKIVRTPSTDEQKQIAWRAHKYKARELLHTGKLDAASAEVDLAEKLGAPADELDLVKQAAASTKRHKILAEPELGKDIPLGGYHLFGKLAELGDVAEVTLFNADTADHEVKVEAEILGTTERVTRTVTLLGGKTQVVALNPPLKAGWDVNSIRADAPAQLALKVTRDGKDAVVDQTYPVTLLPRDTLPLGRFLDRDRTVFRRTPSLIAAWVTPNDKAVEGLLAAAKKRLPAGASLSGGQAATRPQVQAVYDELHDRGMSYVMDPGLFVEGKAAQRTRLPRDVLASTNAQCIEGAILYAAAMEAIGLKPVVTLVPGHSFAAWHSEAHDPTPSGPTKIDRIAGLFFLETTLTHNATFDKAFEYGMHEAYVDHGKEWTAAVPGLLGSTVSDYVDITALRKQGVTPQPWP